MGMTRREFLAAGGAALLAGRSRAASGEDADVRRALDGYLSAGLFGGIVCTSTAGALYAGGRQTLAADSPAMASDSLFDLASIGKTQTAALCALLAAQGRLDVDAPFTEYVTEHVLAKENCTITVRDLATHSGGFDNSKPYQVADVDEFFAKLYAKRPVRARGAAYEYACSNFIYLGLVVEKITGMDLDTAAKQMLWGPLGMNATTWNTVVGNPRAVEYAASTYGGPTRRIGEHNDLTCYYAPRPTGNGSNFSTAPDMQLFVNDMLTRRTFPQAYYDLQFAESFNKGGYRRSFGWDMTGAHSTFSSWTPTRFSDSAICHTGWTGGAIAVDPANGFAGVVMASQKAGKEATMGPRMQLLDLMAFGRRRASCIIDGTLERGPSGSGASAAGASVSACASVPSGGAFTTAFDSRRGSEALSRMIALDTRRATAMSILFR